jgi:hypothetical protein
VACTTCPVNSNSPSQSSAVTACICNAGYNGPSGGPCTLLTGYTPGNTLSGGVCVPCYYGTFKSTTGYETCTTCTAGQQANLGATACTSCAGTASVSFSGQCPGGASTTGTSSGRIIDGSGFYGDNWFCDWIIASSSTITLSFSSIKTEQNYDYVSVWRCTSPVSCTDTLWVTSGQPGTGTFSSSTGYMKVRFQSDVSVTDDGFVASWSLGSGLCKCYPGQYSSLGTAPCSNCAAGKYSGATGATSESTYLTCPVSSNSPSASSVVTDCTCNVGASGPAGGSVCGYVLQRWVHRPGRRRVLGVLCRNLQNRERQCGVHQLRGGDVLCYNSRNG